MSESLAFPAMIVQKPTQPWRVPAPRVRARRVEARVVASLDPDATHTNVNDVALVVVV
jgi:hypothetical protein